MRDIFVEIGTPPVSLPNGWFYLFVKSGSEQGNGTVNGCEDIFVREGLFQQGMIPDGTINAKLVDCVILVVKGYAR